jgi:4-amino-4-deoxy-L-arabinose transferase-like glycosyltransferase
MLLCLPVVAFIIFYLTLRRNGSDWRKGILAAAVLWGTSVAAINEVLSVPRLITRQNVAILWLTICIVGFLYLKVISKRVSSAPVEFKALGEKLDRVTTGLLATTGVMALVVAITAVISAPNVWDAMEYHLPRVMMWMSNRSVRFFATPDYPQLIFGPWAEYAMMHTYLLWGGDRLVNLIEFFSMLGSMVGVSLIVKMLGGSPRGQAIAAVVCATITEGALEASGPMNTYVVAFWITTTVAFLLMWNEDPSWLNTILVGLSAGLALLTKGTAYVYPQAQRMFSIPGFGNQRPAVFPVLPVDRLATRPAVPRCWTRASLARGPYQPTGNSRKHVAQSLTPYRHTLFLLK